MDRHVIRWRFTLIPSQRQASVYAEDGTPTVQIEDHINSLYGSSNWDHSSLAPAGQVERESVHGPMLIIPKARFS